MLSQLWSVPANKLPSGSSLTLTAEPRASKRMLVGAALKVIETVTWLPAGYLAMTKWPRRLDCQHSSLSSVQNGFSLP